jgi:multidrug resistance efflux pump
MKSAAYRYLVTLVVVAVAAGATWFLYQKYVTDPWTLPQRFPVRVQITGKPPIRLRIGQTVTVAVLAKSSPTPQEISKQP